jgi:hypothetical protein
MTPEERIKILESLWTLPQVAPFGLVIGELVELLGLKTVAYIGGFQNSELVKSWIDRRASLPSPRDREVFRTALQAMRLISKFESSESAAAWMVGTNSRLGCESPASILRMGTPYSRAAVIEAAEEYISEASAAFDLRRGDAGDQYDS